MLYKFFQLVTERPRNTLSIVAGITLISALFIPNLKIDFSIEHLFSEKDALNDQLSMSHSNLLVSNTKLEEITHKFENKTRQLEQTYQSTSWKITKPIRNLKIIITKLLRRHPDK